MVDRTSGSERSFDDWGPMTYPEFEAWAKEIGLNEMQWIPVWYAIGREYERGQKCQIGHPKSPNVPDQAPSGARCLMTGPYE